MTLTKRTADKNKIEKDKPSEKKYVKVSSEDKTKIKS